LSAVLNLIVLGIFDVIYPCIPVWTWDAVQKLSNAAMMMNVLQTPKFVNSIPVFPRERCSLHWYGLVMVSQGRCLILKFPSQNG
jgi:hypothetical protein